MGVINKLSVSNEALPTVDAFSTRSEGSWPRGRKVLTGTEGRDVGLDERTKRVVLVVTEVETSVEETPGESRMDGNF